MPGGLIGALGQFFHQQFGAPPKPQAQQTSGSPASSSSAPSGGSSFSTSGQSPIPSFNDPIVSSLNQHLAQEHPQVSTEDDQLKQEQHAAWGNYDFERCIVIFGRLHELEPDNPDWPEKLKTSYYNRGKQYESEGNIQRATQCYYAALQIDPNFPEAQQAAQELLQKQGAQAAA
jgi:tetratricopeptide (TPR) repeat protein